MLQPADRTNSKTLCLAFNAGNATLAEVRRVSDGAIVAAICAICREEDVFTITPFAVVVEGNPFELFEPPNPEGGFFESQGLDPKG